MNDRVLWHMKRNPKLSELAVLLALAASERGPGDASYQWEARNAEYFQSVLDEHARCSAMTVKASEDVRTP